MVINHLLNRMILQVESNFHQKYPKNPRVKMAKFQLKSGFWKTRVRLKIRHQNHHPPTELTGTAREMDPLTTMASRCETLMKLIPKNSLDPSHPVPWRILGELPFRFNNYLGFFENILLLNLVGGFNPFEKY